LRPSDLLRRIGNTWPAVALLTILGAAYVSISTDTGVQTVVPIGFIAIGLLLLAVGTLRLTRPDWRQMGWWQKHTLFRLAFSWRRSSAEGSSLADRLSGFWQLIFGLFFTIAGVLLLI